MNSNKLSLTCLIADVSILDRWAMSEYEDFICHIRENANSLSSDDINMLIDIVDELALMQVKYDIDQHYHEFAKQIKRNAYHKVAERRKKEIEKS